MEIADPDYISLYEKYQKTNGSKSWLLTDLDENLAQGELQNEISDINNAQKLEAIIECKETDAEQTDVFLDTDDLADLVDYSEDNRSHAK